MGPDCGVLGAMDQGRGVFSGMGLGGDVLRGEGYGVGMGLKGVVFRGLGWGMDLGLRQVILKGVSWVGLGGGVLRGVSCEGRLCLGGVVRGVG